MNDNRNIWFCKIGGKDVVLQSGADAPMRQAIQKAYMDLIGREPEFTFSGWGEVLTDVERNLVEKKP